MADTELRAAVSRSTSVKASAAVLIRLLAQKFADAAEAATSLAALKASIAEQVAEMNATSDDLGVAVTEHTVAEDEPEVPEVPE